MFSDDSVDVLSGNGVICLLGSFCSCRHVSNTCLFLMINITRWCLYWDWINTVILAFAGLWDWGEGIGGGRGERKRCSVVCWERLRSTPFPVALSLLVRLLRPRKHLKCDCSVWPPGAVYRRALPKEWQNRSNLSMRYFFVDYLWIRRSFVPLNRHGDEGCKGWPSVSLLFY